VIGVSANDEAECATTVVAAGAGAGAGADAGAGDGAVVDALAADDDGAHTHASSPVPSDRSV